ncbi:hypothetical protein ACFWOL_28210, partial [Streptomyces sp. NPDC058442]|uniref:hypothetical protein n=1 Tax=Streptomyces sp. NPDC058442 TaxID=3346503 RepID=UPI0036550F26
MKGNTGNTGNTDETVTTDNAADTDGAVAPPRANAVRPGSPSVSRAVPRTGGRYLVRNSDLFGVNEAL